MFHQDSSTVQWAQTYKARRMVTIPLKPKDKAPLFDDWQTPHQDEQRNERAFANGAGVGLLLGRPSGNLADVDLDHATAVAVADKWLPPTGLEFGRKGKEKAHRLYRLPGTAGRVVFAHPDTDKVIVEIRADRLQTRLPPSIHVNADGTEEAVEWASFGEPSQATIEDLMIYCGWTAASAVLIDLWDEFAGRHHDLWLAMAGGLLRGGIDVEYVEKLTEVVCEYAGESDCKGLRDVVRSTADRIDAGDERVTGFKRGGEIMGYTRMRWLRDCFGIAPTDTRDEINVADGNLNRVGDQALASLVAANEPPRIFIGASGKLSRIGRNVEGRAVVQELDDHDLRYEVGRVVRFTKPGKPTKETNDPEPVEVPTPLDVVRNVMARPDLPLPPLVQIVPAPLFGSRSVSSLRRESGYVPEARTYVDLADDFELRRQVSPNPGADEIAAARARLCDDLLGDFPFVADADKAHALALALLPFGRPLIQGATPLHVIEAATPGTGKSLLLEAVTSLATGPGGAPTTPEAESDAEWRKKITSAALAGNGFFAIGNMTQPLDSPSLAEALTSPLWQDRMLGTNKTVQAAIRCVWAVTANNPTLSDELARRSVRIRLDAKTDRPFERTGFRHRLPDWSNKHRTELVHAALTLWAAWIAAGCPAGSQTLGSFDQWAQVMGGVLDVAGVPGFLANAQEFYAAADAEGAKWRALAEVWLDVFGTEPVTVGDLFTLPVVADSFSFKATTHDSAKKEFGHMLGKQRDRWYGDLRIDVAGRNRKGVQTYRLAHRDGQARKGDPTARAEQANPYAQAEVIDLSRARAAR